MLSAHFFGRLTAQLRIGQMIGQLVGGVFVGPYFLEAMGLLEFFNISGYKHAFDTFHFVIFTFLGVIAFAFGEELHFDRVRKIGAKPAVISLIQGGFTWVLLTGFFIAMGWDYSIALVIGSIGVATAPAINFILLNYHEIEGRFRNMVVNILILGDVLEVILFSIFAQLAISARGQESVDALGILGHLSSEFGVALLIGFGVFIFLRVTVRKPMFSGAEERGVTLGPSFVTRLLTAHPTPSIEVLVILFGAVSVGSGLALGMHVPFLITGIFAGVLIANFHTHAIFESLKIENIMPLLNLFFFALIGANVRFDVFGGENLWLIGGYILARAVGKIGGTYIGCKLTRQDPKITHCMPFLMMPQAGVAAVEAVYLIKLLGDPGQRVADVVLPALVIFEMSGVFLSERALLKWRQWTTGESEVLTRRDKAIKETLGLDKKVIAKLAEIVPSGMAGIAIKSNSLAGAVEELAGRLSESGHVVDPDVVVERTMTREKIAPTAMGHGIVFPHSKTLTQMKTVCAIGYFEKPLEGIAGPDRVPIDTIVLLVSPIQRPEEHLEALSTVARLFSGDDFRETFKAAMRSGKADEKIRDMSDERG